MYCEKTTTWPFSSTCAKANTNYEACHEDFECGPSAYCWYATPSDVDTSTTRCLPMYSQAPGTNMGWYSVYSNNASSLTVADYTQNGKYCQSGIAFPIANNSGNCTATDRIVYQGQNLSDPYPCDPTNQTARC